MPALGPWELIIVLLIVVVIFGAGRLSEVGGAMGKSIREFRKATADPDAAAVANAAAPAAPAQVTAPQVAAPQVGGPQVAAPPVAAPQPAATLPANTAAPTALAENKCPSCATVNPASQVFCGQCGTRLTRAA
jgi:sec-independent protein translocase protein TatA